LLLILPIDTKAADIDRVQTAHWFFHRALRGKRSSCFAPRKGAKSCETIPARLQQERHGIYDCVGLNPVAITTIISSDHDDQIRGRPTLTHAHRVLAAVLVGRSHTTLRQRLSDGKL
jgi:hypothetical protein